ncbi:hypothetical protein HHI36_002393 [Cryptolaemus montrouzieri]|uniref:Uncharacterized protein n=1 Tax=Cryptolaemus montrouzieri TaxID=559131 RepID=A0ABD2PB59_9CUCU
MKQQLKNASLLIWPIISSLLSNEIKNSVDAVDSIICLLSTSENRKKRMAGIHTARSIHYGAIWPKSEGGYAN